MAKKRANGEGNIRKRKDGRWEGRYTAGYDEKTGKRGRADEPHLLCLFLEQQKETAEDHQQDEDQVSKRKDLADSRSEPQCIQVQETGRVILFL